MNAQKYIEHSSKLQSYFYELKSANIAKIEVVKYSAGHIIKDENTENDSIFFVVNGITAVYHYIENGEQFRYYYICKNDVIGYSDKKDTTSEYHSFSVKATTDVVLLKISKELLTEILNDYPQFEYKIFNRIIVRLHDSLKTQIECKKYNSNINIVSYLIYSYGIYHTLYDSNYTGHVVINETRSNISDFTGISIRSINNTIDLLKTLNCISIIKGKVNINTKEFELLKSYKLSNI